MIIWGNQVALTKPRYQAKMWKFVAVYENSPVSINLIDSIPWLRQHMEKSQVRLLGIVTMFRLMMILARYRTIEKYMPKPQAPLLTTIEFLISTGSQAYETDYDCANHLQQAADSGVRNEVCPSSLWLWGTRERLRHTEFV